MQSQNLINFNPTPNQSFKICSQKDTEKVLTIQEDINYLIVCDYVGSPSQHFHIYKNNMMGNRYALVSDEKAVRVQNQNLSEGAVVCADSKQFPSSYFQILPTIQGQDFSKGCIIKTFSGKVLDIKGGFSFNNTEICQWEWHGGSNQIWSIIPINQPASYHQNNKQAQPHVQFTPNQPYIIYAAGDSQKALDVSKGFMNSGDLILYGYHGEENQRFYFQQEGGFYRLRSADNGKYVIVQDDDPNDGSKITTDNKGRKSELWRVLPAKNGQYTLKGAYHIQSIFDKALQVGEHFDVNSIVKQSTFNGSLGQTWMIKLA